MISQTNTRLEHRVYDITNSFVNAKFPIKGSSKRHQWILEIEVLFYAQWISHRPALKENLKRIYQHQMKLLLCVLRI